MEMEIRSGSTPDSVLGDEAKNIISKLEVEQNEANRLAAVRRSGICIKFDSIETCNFEIDNTGMSEFSSEDIDFDKFTSLAKRIFNVPISLVTLVDNDRLFFKSHDGIEATEMRRSDGLSSYVVLPNSPDVLIVPDARNHPQFSETVVVKGPPHVVFYAGAAIYFQDQKIGSFCLIDTVPRPEFSLHDKMNLLDLSSSLAVLIRERQMANLRMKEEKSRLLFNMMHQLRTPLTALEVAKDLISPTSGFMEHVLVNTTAESAQSFKDAYSEIDSAMKDVSSLVNTLLPLNNIETEALAPL